jgi:hypothetical protein
MDSLELRLTRLVPVVRCGATTDLDAVTINDALTEIAALRARVRDIEDTVITFEVDARMAIERLARGVCSD